MLQDESRAGASIVQFKQPTLLYPPAPQKTLEVGQRIGSDTHTDKQARKMANQSQGDGRAVNWSFPLPPKSPAFPSSASGSVLESTAAGRSSVVPIHGGVHKRNPSAGYLSQVLHFNFPSHF